LGYLSAKLICKSLCFDLTIKAKDLSSEDWTKVSNIIKIKYKFLLDNEVKKNIHDNIQKLKNIKSYKGIRHLYGLPVNGQRTRTNAKTRGWK
jgi:small subunit ribosomal protein S13